METHGSAQALQTQNDRMFLTLFAKLLNFFFFCKIQWDNKSGHILSIPMAGDPVEKQKALIPMFLW